MTLLRLVVLFAVILFALPLAASGTAYAAEPAPGKEVRVQCKSDETQSYACYLPKAYTAKRPWPILYCFSPNARGDVFVQRYRQVCEERGWIVVGSMNSRNGPWAPIDKAIKAMWADAEARFELHPTMRYVTGFSGGARVSFAVARMHAEHIAGIIAIGAGLPPDGNPVSKQLAAYLTCGETDPNKRELDPLSKTLEKAGNPVRYRNFKGGHVMPPVALLEEAVRWLDDLAPARRAAALKEALLEAEALVGRQEPLEAYVGLRSALAALADVKDGRKPAEALLKKLSRDPAVKPEVAAYKLLLAFDRWFEKNGAKAKRFAHVHKQAQKKLRAIGEKYPGTPSAKTASERLTTLTAPAK